MTIARAHLVDPAMTRSYRFVTRCVRRAFLLGEGMHDRKSWIEHRLEELAEIFSVAVAGFAILDNHLHLLVRLDPDVAQGWSDSDEDVVRRWGRLFPPRDKARQVAPVSDEWVQARLKDARWVATARERLQSLNWFMKCLKEPLSRLANRAEQTRGAFFEGRFKSVATLDGESIDRGEERAHGITGRKTVMRSIDGVGSGRTNPLRSRSCHQEETTFRRRSQDWGIPVVNSVCWDNVDCLCQFGVRLRSARCSSRKATRGVCSLTRGKPTRPICGSCKSRGKARLGGLAKA